MVERHLGTVLSKLCDAGETDARGTTGHDRCFPLQIGAQQYAHALFFMTDQSLQDFRRAPGWNASADIRYATPGDGGSLGKETTELDSVIAFVFGQQGLMVGATLAGVKYSRIIP